MEQILESLNVSEEIKTELQESFDKAVLVKAVELAESKESEYEEYMLSEMTTMKTELENTLDNYLEKVVEQFIVDNTFAIDEAIKSEKYEAVLEGFNSLMIATGVEVAQIAEAKEEIEIEEGTEGVAKSLKTSEEMADTLMEENLALKSKNAELLRTGLVKETAETMTPLQKDKFFKLAKIVEFDASNPQDFISKLDTLSESLKVEKVEKTEKVEITEKVEVKELNEGKIEATKYVSVASHLY